MAGKLLELNEAAAKLGITVDQLSEMRQRGEVYAMRDGGTWKFKEDEIERVLSERAGGGSAIGGDLDDLIKPLSLDDDDSGDDLGSILVSEQELGKSGESTSSTVIGKTIEPKKGGADSDITLAGDSDKGSSDVQLVKPGSDLNLGTSDVDLAAQSDLKLAGEGGTGKAGSDVSLGSGKLDFATDSALDLGDDDLVLGGSGIGSDVTLGGGDSGINLASPADSGLSLEQEPVDLMGGSNVDASFELPEDDDVISLSSDLADAEEATQLKADEEFLLSPAGDLGGDESDSGSQVIALEDSEAFDENADTMLRPAQPALVVEDVGAGFDQVTTMTPGGVAPAATQQYMTTAAPEAPYTIWNVLGLLCCVFLLSITGMLMTDLMRNMWAFDSERVMSTGLMDSILSAVGMK
jgi:hypothetical protein